ncbi:MAG: hypothetical protein H6Q70_800 [Firmicutes bacterium]|nr:hypothetical protein [Bacillota bacterium]
MESFDAFKISFFCQVLLRNFHHKIVKCDLITEKNLKLDIMKLYYNLECEGVLNNECINNY